MTQLQPWSWNLATKALAYCRTVRELLDERGEPVLRWLGKVLNGMARSEAQAGGAPPRILFTG